MSEGVGDRADIGCLFEWLVQVQAEPTLNKVQSRRHTGTQYQTKVEWIREDVYIQAK